MSAAVPTPAAVPTGSSSRLGLVGFLAGAAGMFATMYSTQAILPELGRSFDVGPARAGLTVSVVVLAIALGAWLWGPLSDRMGRRRTLILASALLVAPTAAAALAPTFPLLLACRILQGLCMPGLLTVGVPYVMAAFAPTLGSRVMGWYVATLVLGGLIGRVGVAGLTQLVGWRVAVGVLAVLPLTAALVMSRTLPQVAPPARAPARRVVAGLLRNRRLLQAAAVGSAIFFAFVGTFTYVEYRLERAPFSLGAGGDSLVFLLWGFGAVGPVMGRVAERLGWRPVALGAVLLSVGGLLLSVPAHLPTLVVGLALMTIGMFTGATAAQLGLGGATTGDQGVAAALYFSCYYGSGALGGFLPGLAWQAWRWPGVVAVALLAQVVALAALAAGRVGPRRPVRAHAG